MSIHPQFSARLAGASGPNPPPLPEISGRRGVQSVERAFAILRILEAAAGPLTLKAIAESVGEAPSKAHHYLLSLKRVGAVEQLASGLYRLGPFALQLGFAALNRDGLLDVCLEVLTQFRDRTGETAFAASWGNRGPTIVSVARGRRAITVDANPGLVMPLLNSATGLVFVTWLDEYLWQPVAAWESANVPESDLAAVPHRVAAARAAGLALADGMLTDRISSMSVPVFGHDGALVCALTTLGWRGELDIDPDGALASALREAGATLARLLGNQQ